MIITFTFTIVLITKKCLFLKATAVSLQVLIGHGMDNTFAQSVEDMSYFIGISQLENNYPMEEVSSLKLNGTIIAANLDGV